MQYLSYNMTHPGKLSSIVMQSNYRYQSLLWFLLCKQEERDNTVKPIQAAKQTGTKNGSGDKESYDIENSFVYFLQFPV
jgi:hypothetical protein